ncbi:MAG: hypothetical protein H5U40_06865 [Polyangiaceae bacterium]|nr:hypothetical protein [Polyangiaceae bacterium]
MTDAVARFAGSLYFSVCVAIVWWALVSAAVVGSVEDCTDERDEHEALGIGARLR